LDDIRNIVQNRSTARWEGDYERADALKQQLHCMLLPDGMTLSIEDLPRCQGGRSTWHLVYKAIDDDEEEFEGPTVLQLAHAALGLAVACSQKTVTPHQKEQELERLVQRAKETLLEWKSVHLGRGGSTSHPSSRGAGWRVVETTLGGRKSADAAFWFALAGATDQQVMDLLADVCMKEMERFGTNPSCRIKDITQMMDRFAACGVQHTGLERVAKESLATKLAGNDDTSILTENLLDLHSDRCLLMLWKFAARQKKQQSFLQSAKIHWEKSKPATHNDLENKFGHQTTCSVLHDDSALLDWFKCFEDPSRPLVVDIGCGMGISLLGLALNTVGISEEDFQPANNVLEMSSEYNFLGVDLSSLAIGYAQGVAQRRGLSGRLYFTVDTAESVLAQIADSYPGPFSIALIQFPTPYRLPMSTTVGNSQLPNSALEGFMVSPRLLHQICQALSKSNGKLLLQSNCEDVAVWMLHAARDVGFESVSMRSFRTIEQLEALDLTSLPQRTRNWVEMSGERAVGSSWSASPLLPRRASTETELACRLNETPIHRCLLTPKVSVKRQ
jgi:SAM-dependent methyltransferase